MKLSDDLIQRAHKSGDEIGLVLYVSRGKTSTFYGGGWRDPYTMLTCNPLEAVYDAGPDGTQTWFTVKSTGAKPTVNQNIGYVDDGQTLEGERLYVAMTNPKRLVYRGGRGRYTLLYR